MNISENFARARKNAKISQQVLANKIGVDRSFITQIESGLRLPSINVAVQVALALDCSLDALIGMDKLRKEV